MCLPIKRDIVQPVTRGTGGRHSEIRAGKQIPEGCLQIGSIAIVNSLARTDHEHEAFAAS